MVLVPLEIMYAQCQTIVFFKKAYNVWLSKITWREGRKKKRRFKKTQLLDSKHLDSQVLHRGPLIVTSGSPTKQGRIKGKPWHTEMFFYLLPIMVLVLKSETVYSFPKDKLTAPHPQKYKLQSNTPPPQERLFRSHCWNFTVTLYAYTLGSKYWYGLLLSKHNIAI